jgi:hypothetical protein
MKKSLFVLILSTFLGTVNAQITGLWEVTLVTVGDEEMTPHAKWTVFNEDGTFESGNGGLKNSNGKWEFDKHLSQLRMTNEVGFDNTFGPFQVEMNPDNEMILSRTEEGQKVMVYNQRVSEKPMYRTDLATGLWDLRKAERGGVDVLDEMDPEGSRMFFIRWDNLFQDITVEGRISGIWRIDAHRPVLDVLYYDQSKSPDYWQISFKGEDVMYLQKEDLKLEFGRLTSFPE